MSIKYLGTVIEQASIVNQYTMGVTSTYQVGEQTPFVIRTQVRLSAEATPDQYCRVLMEHDKNLSDVLIGPARQDVRTAVLAARKKMPA